MTRRLRLLDHVLCNNVGELGDLYLKGPSVRWRENHIRRGRWRQWDPLFCSLSRRRAIVNSLCVGPNSMQCRSLFDSVSMWICGNCMIVAILRTHPYNRRECPEKELLSILEVVFCFPFHCRETLTMLLRAGPFGTISFSTSDIGSSSRRGPLSRSPFIPFFFVCSSTPFRTRSAVFTGRWVWGCSTVSRTATSPSSTARSLRFPRAICTWSKQTWSEWTSRPRNTTRCSACW